MSAAGHAGDYHEKLLAYYKSAPGFPHVPTLADVEDESEHGDEHFYDFQFRQQSWQYEEDDL